MFLNSEMGEKTLFCNYQLILIYDVPVSGVLLASFHKVVYVSVGGRTRIKCAQEIKPDGCH